MSTFVKFSFLFLVLLVLSGCDQGEFVGPSSKVTTSESNLTAHLSIDDAASGPRSWSEVSLDYLWAYVAQGDSIVDIGLKAVGASEGVRGAEILISEQQRIEATQNIINTLNTEVLSKDDTLPIIRIKVNNKGQLQALRSMPFVEYVEPGYIISELEGGFLDSEWSGCGDPNYGGAISTVSPGDKMSPNLANSLHVEDAWSLSSGDNVTVAVIGTGVSRWQPQLNEDFTDGYSGGRSFNRDWTWDDPVYPNWHDDCGHETRVIGVLAAPRDGKGIAGIAYEANLHSVRVDDDVSLTNTEDVSEAIGRVAFSSDIVNMAFGTYRSFSVIEDEIQYWYDQNDELLFIGAAGTSTSLSNDWVVFPASMQEVMAVTGMNTDGTPCGICHYGEKVLFAVKTHQLTLNPMQSSGGDPYTIVGFGGASYATSAISGIAALVRARYPNLDRDGVIAQLRRATRSYNFGYKSDETGWGEPDAYCAVGGLCFVLLTGQIEITTPGYYTYTAEEHGGTTPVDYQWYVDGQAYGGNTQSIDVYFAPGEFEQYILLKVKVTDEISGVTRTDIQTVIVREQGSGSCAPKITCG